jgi:hypothetical protein
MGLIGKRQFVSIQWLDFKWNKHREDGNKNSVVTIWPTYYVIKDLSVRILSESSIGMFRIIFTKNAALILWFLIGDSVFSER